MTLELLHRLWTYIVDKFVVVILQMEKEEGKNKYSKEFKVPPNFDEVLRCLTREILRNQPEDINKFGKKYSSL